MVTYVPMKILHLELPPLRERYGDAEQLAQHFVAQLCAEYRLPLKRFDEAAFGLDPATPGPETCASWRTGCTAPC